MPRWITAAEIVNALEELGPASQDEICAHLRTTDTAGVARGMKAAREGGLIAPRPTANPTRKRRWEVV